MKKLSFLVAAAFMLVTVAGFESCKSASKTSTSKLLKFNLEKGKGYDYELKSDLKTEGSGQESDISITGRYSMNITGSEGGVTSVTTFYKSLRMYIKARGIEMDIDSDKPSVDNGDKDLSKNPLGIMNKIISGIVNKKFVIKVDEEGKVLEVTGFEKILSDMADSLGLEGAKKEQVIASLKDQFSEQTIKDQFAQVFTIFPNKEIKIGDTWEKKYTTGGKMAATYTSTYTAKAIEGDHVTLTTKTVISGGGGAQEIDGTQNGSIVLDSKTGLMINAEYDQAINVKSGGQSVAVIGKTKIKGTAN